MLLNMKVRWAIIWTIIASAERVASFQSTPTTFPKTNMKQITIFASTSQDDAVDASKASPLPPALSVPVWSLAVPAAEEEVRELSA